MEGLEYLAERFVAETLMHLLDLEKSYQQAKKDDSFNLSWLI